MPLNICAEVLWRILIHIATFAISHWLLLLLAFFILFKFNLKTLGIVGSGVNLLGFIDGPLTVVDPFTMFLQALIWGMIIFQSPITLPVRILLIPVFALSGFIWDALGALPHMFWLNFIPLTFVLTLALTFYPLNYFVIALPTIWMAKLFLWASSAVCRTLNEIIILFEAPCRSFLSNIPVLGWILGWIIGC